MKNTSIASSENIEKIANILLKQVDAKIFHEKYAKVEDVLRLVGAGVFLGAALVAPNLPKALAPFFHPDAEEPWERFNVPYLERTLKRLEKENLVNINKENGMKIVKVSEKGEVRILKYALEALILEKPVFWNGDWWIVSYDIPKGYEHKRDILREYLTAWKFYPLHESVFLHAYPCFEQVKFLRDYLGISEYVRIFRVSEIENDQLFKNFFGI